GVAARIAVAAVGDEAARAAGGVAALAAGGDGRRDGDGRIGRRAAALRVQRRVEAQIIVGIAARAAEAACGRGVADAAAGARAEAARAAGGGTGVVAIGVGRGLGVGLRLVAAGQRVAAAVGGVGVVRRGGIVQVDG